MAMPPAAKGTSSTTSFISRRVNGSTFLVIENDHYGEQPYIYVKLYPNHVLLTDTGCNSPRSKDRSVTALREYLETWPLSINDGQCLNPGGKKSYVIICSHCHYDHILGIPQFLDTTPVIIASDFDKSFILDDLPQSSLCKFIDVPTPQYTVSRWARHLEYLSLDGLAFRIQFLHIPGHTPDSLAWYDVDENHLYVGDTFYERKRAVPIPELPDDAGQVPGLPATQAAIIFPEEGGNWIQFMSSLEMLRSFVQHKNVELTSRLDQKRHTLIKRVKVACGHLTYNADAEDMIAEVHKLFEHIIAGNVPVTSSGMKRGIIHDFWLESEKARYSVMAPRHVAEEARKHFRSK